MIQKVTDKKQLLEFIYFIKDLYKGEANFAYPIFSSLKKELYEEVLVKKQYTALLYKEDNKTLGRILYTISHDKSSNQPVCFFSFFDCVNKTEVAKALFEYLTEDVRSQGINHIEGTYCPYDPDTRRGILVHGFDQPHTILTSYNFDYYEHLLIECGFNKAYDTYTLNLPLTDEFKRRTAVIATRFNRLYDVRIDNLNKKNVDQDINDVFQIFQEASTELNYQEPPSKEMITSVLKSLKFLINAKLVKIARENATNAPIGFCFILPDFNQIFKKTKGKIDIFKLLSNKNKISSARGMLQYVVPKYQRTGLLYAMYDDIVKTFDQIGVTHFEGGTILEENTDSWKQFEKLGGHISKVYRIFSKEI